MDFVFVGAVEDGRRHVDTAIAFLRKFDDIVFTQAIDELDRFGLRIRFFERCAQFLAVIGSRRLQHAVDLQAHAASAPAQVHFQNLTDVHTARYAKRIENEIDRRAIFEIRHIFDGQDVTHDALVTVTTGHLIADLDLALNCDAHFDDFENARREFVAFFELGNFIVEISLRFFALLIDECHDLIDFSCDRTVFDLNILPKMSRNAV